MTKKTRDGISLEKVVKVARQLGLSVKEGSKHPYLLIYKGMVPCPVATSTDVRRMVVPWIRKSLDYDTETLYSYFKKGKRMYE